MSLGRLALARTLVKQPDARLTRYGFAVAAALGACVLARAVVPWVAGHEIVVGAGALALAAAVHGAARARGRLAFLRAMTRALDEGVYTIDRAGRITWVNAAALRMLGYRAPELVGRPFREALRCRRTDAPCGGGTRCRLQNVMVSGQPYRAENDMLTRKDGTCFPVRYSSAPILRGGSVVGAVVAFQDVTAERRAAANERFLAEATAQLARSIDDEETLARVARLALPRLGDWCMAIVLEEDGKPRRVAVEARDPGRAEAALEMLRRYPIDLEADHGAGRVLRTGEPELMPVVGDFVGSGGTTVATRAALLEAIGLRSFMAVPMRVGERLVGVLDFGVTGAGRRFGVEDLALAIELANRCAIAVENARLHAQARDAVRARERVLAVVSHDLRNPLGAISIAAGVLRAAAPEGASGRRVRDVAAGIARSCDRMNRLVGDLADLARVDAGHVSIVRRAVPALALAADAVEAAAAPAAEAGVRVECQVSDDGPRVDCDADRIHQVLGNLLSNAVKITPRGGRVWVRCRTRRGLASFSVSDTGPGIPREQQRGIFDPFVRGAGARYPGTGLGLSIARAIVEAHGGRLWVVSRPGKGATFRFTLPLAGAAREDGAAQGAAGGVACPSTAARAAAGAGARAGPAPAATGPA